MADELSTEILEFWEVARVRAGVSRTGVVTGFGVTASMVPQTWAFGDGPELADELLTLVLDGTKTATASALAEYENADEPLPRAGDLSIVLDGAGHPRALLRTTQVETVAFDDVPAEHARAEGEGDRTLESWRREHERYWRRVLVPQGHEFDARMPVLLERFEVLYPRSADR